MGCIALDVGAFQILKLQDFKDLLPLENYDKCERIKQKHGIHLPLMFYFIILKVSHFIEGLQLPFDMFIPFNSVLLIAITHID